MKLWSQLRGDLRELATMASQGQDGKSLFKLAVQSDSFAITSLHRIRGAAKRCRVPGVNHLLRVVQTAYFGIELGNEIDLGEGVWFIHPLGIVVGGDAKVGDRVRFFGNNTVGTAKENGYPVIEDDVWVGAGARILGPIRIGRGARIGANAVVLTDVPAGAVAVGVPAKIKGAK